VVDFSYLKQLDVPQNLKVSHSVVSLLIKSSLPEMEEDSVGLSEEHEQLKHAIQELSVQEKAFQIARLEYEKKETRFVELSKFNQEKLDLLYFQHQLIFRDIDQESMSKAIDKGLINEIITTIDNNIEIIQAAIQTCYDRIQLLTKNWKEHSQELMEQINNFEQRGLKLVSNNLRLKLIPTLKELKSVLKSNLVKGAESRLEVSMELKSIVERSREDIFGDLTDEQIALLEDLEPILEIGGLRKILENPQLRADFLELVDSGKIIVSIRKLIDQLI
jgi:hypothetical protein